MRRPAVRRRRRARVAQGERDGLALRAGLEGQIDSLGPGIYCEQPGADAAETQCEQGTAKAIAKLGGAIEKCYDKCKSNARRGVIAPDACDAPNPADWITQACISRAD